MPEEAARISGRCVLCGKTREHVKKLILGVHGGVCLDCIGLCNDILRSEGNSPQEQAEKTAFPSQRAEWLPPRTVLLCEPAMETLFGLLEVHAVNFQRPYSLQKAIAEHRAFRIALESAGATVRDLRGVLAAGAEEPGPARDRLERWAAQSVHHEFGTGMTPADRQEVRDRFAEALRVFDARSLVDLLFLRPTLHVSLNARSLDTTSRLDVKYSLAPVTNAYYLRDPLMTTAKGCVIGRLRLEARRQENEIARYALTLLGIEPLHVVQEPGFLEGGDFLPCGDFVLQGQGLLTNAEGVRQCLEHGVYGFVEVGVVEDPRGQMDEMHLDTYFTVLDHNLAALCDDRKGNREPQVTVYAPEGTPERTVYRQTRQIGMRAYLAEKGMRLLDFSKSEQEAYAPNGVVIGPRHYLAVRGCGEHFARALENAGVSVQWLDFSALTGGYGGPHCSSQVLWRG